MPNDPAPSKAVTPQDGTQQPGASGLNPADSTVTFVGSELGFDKPQPKSNEEKLLHVYIKQLLSELNLLQISPAPTEGSRMAASERIAKMRQKSEAEWRWSDAYELERCMVILEPIERLRRRLPLIRDEYAALAGDETYKKYIASEPPLASDPNSPEPLLRADALAVLSEMHWLYMAITAEDREREGVVRGLGWFVTTAIWIFVGIYFVIYMADVVSCWPLCLPFPTAIAVAGLGVLGAHISAKRRLDSIPFSGNQVANFFEIQRRPLSTRTAMFAGAVFALVLYGILLGKLITGPLFPEFKPRILQDPLIHLWLGVKPIDITSYGKLFVWAFIAGFAERLVPDLLGSFADTASKAAART